jgi:hypothetical protein
MGCRRSRRANAARPRRVARFGQEIGQSLMRLALPRVETQGDLVMVARLFGLLQIRRGEGQVGMSDGIVRVMPHRLREGGARGRAVAHRMGQLPQPGERAEMRLVPAQNMEIGLHGIVVAAECRQQLRPFDPKVERIGCPPQPIFDGGKGCFPLGKGRPIRHAFRSQP